MTGETILTNVRLVLRDDVIDGTLKVANDCIDAVDEGRSSVPSAIDCGGDYVIPGLVELHTDNLEKHFAPRPGVSWPAMEAALAHDTQLAAAGITTVFDAVCLGDLFRNGSRVNQFDRMMAAIAHGAAENLFRAEHGLHLRCELSFDGVVDMFDAHADNPLVRLVSLMDHTPGQRQFVDETRYRLYYQRKYGLSDAEMDAFIADQRHAHDRFARSHRAMLVERAHARGLPIASHDDATEDHVAEAARDGAAIAEFPTTMKAARAARRQRLRVLMGAPNLVLGGSHSGNISAKALNDDGLLDILSSDYVPSSLVQAVFLLARGEGGISLPAAVAKATATPAAAAGLDDRGEIAIGKRADLVRISLKMELAVVASVWRAGVRVA